MTEPIFLKNKEGALIPLTETLYEKEEDLQKMLANHPELIYSISDQIPQLLLIAQEAGIPGEDGANDDFSLDHIFVDFDAKPTFVEVKRSTDTRIRREVIGQMFDYAAHARAYWTADKIQIMYKATCQKNGQNPETVLQSFIGEERNPDQFWEQFMTNLKGGNIRLIFAADTIPKRLQLIVEFLRDYMDPCEVRALEIRQFLGQDNLQMIAPHYVGGSVKADMRKSSTLEKRRWTEEAFMEKLSRDRPENEVRFVNKIFTWAKQRNIEPYWGVGPSSGSCYFKIFGEEKCSRWFGLWTDGNMEFRFNCLRLFSPFDDEKIARQYIQKISTLTGFQINEDQMNKYVNIHPPKDQELQDQLISMIELAIQEINSKKSED